MNKILIIITIISILFVSINVIPSCGIGRHGVKDELIQPKIDYLTTLPKMPYYNPPINEIMEEK